MPFTLEIRTYDGGGRHAHPFSQILIPVRGAMKLDIEGLGAQLSGHRVAVVPPDHVHLFKPTPDCKLLVIDVVSKELPEYRIPRLLRDDKPHIVPVEPWLWRLFQLLAREADGDVRRARDAADIAMTGLQLIDPEAKPVAPPPGSRRLLGVVQKLRDGRQGRRKVAELASDAALSPSQFHALFRAMEGQSPKQFQLRKLLDRAADKLVTTSDPISAIAHELGYENVSSFNRIFKKHFGITPTEFRLSGRADRSK